MTTVNGQGDKYNTHTISFHSGFESENYHLKSNNSLNRLLMSDANVDAVQAGLISKTLEEHISELVILREKYKNSKFLRLVFRRTHNKLLKRYKMFCSFSDIFNKKGSYDCVSGTALLAYVYNALGYKTVIKETTFHMYLMVMDKDARFLVESTDPLNGFVSEPSEIRERIDRYSDMTDKNGYKFKNVVDNNINIEHLVALQYYNRAVNQYNQGHYSLAYFNIVKASDLYSSSRVKEIKELIISDLLKDDLIAKN